MIRNTFRWFGLAAVAITIADVTPVFADEADGRLDVQIIAINVRSFTSRSLDGLRGPVELQLKITNNSDAEERLIPTDFALTCGKARSPFTTSSQKPQITAPLVLQPGEVRSGWIAFHVITSVPEEVPMELSFRTSTVEGKVSVNDALRSITGVSTQTLGPDHCLTVVTLQRQIDQLTLWLLTEVFLELQKQGVERVVITTDGTESAVPLRSDIRSWLSTVRRGFESEISPFGAQVTSPVQFHVFHVGGYRPTSSRITSDSSFIHLDRAHAVAAALNDLYERMPAAEAIQDRHAADSGVRRAAFASSIDRLSLEELTVVIQEAEDGSRETQEFLAEYLYRVAGPIAVETLHRLALQEDKAVSAAAVRGLIRCLIPAARDEINTLWRNADHPDFRSRIFDEIIDARDARWANLVAEYATTQLRAASRDHPALVQNPSSVPSPVGDGNPQAAIDGQRVRLALQFLTEIGDARFAETAREQLLYLRNPEVQDVVLKYILESADSDDANAELVRAYCDQRLNAGRVTTTVTETLSSYPDARYTKTLLKLSTDPSTHSTQRRNLFLAALNCATDQQMDAIAEAYEGLDRNTRPLALQKLAAMHHPAWLKMAEAGLREDGNMDSYALNVLRSARSPEALAIILDRLQETLDQIEQEFQQKTDSDKDAPATPNPARRNFARLPAVSKAQRIMTSGLMSSMHPETRRMLQRFLLCSSSELQRHAYNILTAMDQRSLVYKELAEVSQFRREHKYDEALQRVNQLVERDPLCCDALMTRASLNLRADRVQEALADLVEANRLCPEDVVNECTLAIAMVRTGSIVEGIALAESVLARIPTSSELEVSYLFRRLTLYNTACVYGRALEMPEITPEQREEFLEKGFALYRQSIDAGFDEPDHVLNDPDLNAFHDHPEWDAAFELLKEKEKESAERRRQRAE